MACLFVSLLLWFYYLTLGLYNWLCLALFWCTALVLSPCALCSDHRGPEVWNLAWRVRARVSYGHAPFLEEAIWEDLSDILVWVFWNIGYLLGTVGIFLVSIVCDFECDCECDCGVPFMLRLVYTIDFNELTGIQKLAN